MIEMFFIFIFGLIIGSFLNCVIWRIYKGESFLLGKSYCPHCRHDLNVLDLIPLLSYLFLRRKCRYCGKKISIQYPLVELATALSFVFVVPEEQACLNKYGDAYREYMNRTPRWLGMPGK